MEFLALLVAVVALVRTWQLERELRELRRQVSRIQAPAPVGSPPGFTPATLTSATPAASTAPPGRPPADAAAAASRAPTIAFTPPHVPGMAPPSPVHTGVETEPPLDQAIASSSIERSIGERYLLYAGMLVLVLAVASFLRYAFDQQWLSPVVRVMAGAAAGVSLAIGGRLLARAGYRPYGLFLSGGGLVMLFLSAYAAFAFYALIGQSATFVILAAVAGVAALLADRERSQPLALLAVTGGFATPFLVGGDTDAQLTLFSYVAVLIAVAASLSHRRDWPWLGPVALALTVLTVVGWAEAHYTDGVWLRTELYLTFYCAMFLALLRAGRTSGELPGQVAAATLWAAPVLYHWASIAILSPRAIPFLVYLVFVSAAVIAFSVAARSGAPRLVGWVLVIVPLLVWVTTSEGRSSPAAVSLAASGIWLMFTVAVVWTIRAPADPGVQIASGDIVLIHANGPALFAALYILWSADWPPLALSATGGVLAAVHVGMWSSMRMLTPGALHWLGAAATLTAVAVAVGFEGRWVVAMWSAEAAVLVWLGVRHGAPWFQTAGVALFGVAAAAWFVWQPDPRIPRIPLLNAQALAAAFTVAMLYTSAWLMRDSDVPAGRDRRLRRTGLLLGASLLTVIVVSFEIAAFWLARPESAIDAVLAMQLMLSAWWAAYAALLVAAGMRLSYVPIRYLAIGLFAFTLLKVFTVDVWQLAGVYRVIGFLAVGIILLLASFLYQRARSPRDSARAA